MQETIILKTMSIEMYWLLLTVLMTSLFWVPYILNRLVEQGVFTGLWDPEGVTRARAKWAGRMMHAHTNAIENLAVFAPLVLILQLLEISTPVTAKASMIYFFARAAHYVVFSLGIPVIRIVVFLIGFACQIALASSLFDVI